MSHNLVLLRYLSSSRSHGFRLPDPLMAQLRARTMSSKSSSWSAVVAASVPKSYKAQALRLVPGLEARLTIREGVLVTMTGDRRVEITPEDLISFLVTKKKTSIAPEMLAQLLPEIDVIKPSSISPTSKKILEEARKLSQSRHDSEHPSSVSPPVKASKKKKKEVKSTKENEKKTEPIKVLHVKDVFSQANFKEELKRIGTEGKDLVNPSVIGQVVSQETSVKVEKANSSKNNLSDLKKASKREPMKTSQPQQVEKEELITLAALDQVSRNPSSKNIGPGVNKIENLNETEKNTDQVRSQEKQVKPLISEITSEKKNEETESSSLDKPSKKMDSKDEQSETVITGPTQTIESVEKEPSSNEVSSVSSNPIQSGHPDIELGVNKLENREINETEKVESAEIKVFPTIEAKDQTLKQSSRVETVTPAETTTRLSNVEHVTKSLKNDDLGEENSKFGTVNKSETIEPSKEHYSDPKTAAAQSLGGSASDSGSGSMNLFLGGLTLIAGGFLINHLLGATPANAKEAETTSASSIVNVAREECSSDETEKRDPTNDAITTHAEINSPTASTDIASAVLPDLEVEEGAVEV